MRKLIKKLKKKLEKEKDLLKKQNEENEEIEDVVDEFEELEENEEFFHAEEIDEETLANFKRNDSPFFPENMIQENLNNLQEKYLK